MEVEALFKEFNLIPAATAYLNSGFAAEFRSILQLTADSFCEKEQHSEVEKPDIFYYQLMKI